MIEIPSDLVVIGLGGNIGTEDEIRARFVRARSALAELGSVRSASLYRTAPIGPAQPNYLNTAVSVRFPDDYAPTPDELIATVLEIEALSGRDRRRAARWGPRTIDLDILVWGNRQIRHADLEVPHPRLYERRFALRPLLDLLDIDAPELEARVAAQHLELVATSW